MKIKKMRDQIRRDFWADYECEECGHIEYNVPGYDDAYFHSEVIPGMTCRKCRRQAKDDYKPRATKYHESEVV